MGSRWVYQRSHRCDPRQFACGSFGRRGGVPPSRGAQGQRSGGLRGRLRAVCERRLSVWREPGSETLSPIEPRPRSWSCSR